MLKCSNVPACIHRPGVFPKPAGLTVSLQKHYSGSQRTFWHDGPGGEDGLDGQDGEDGLDGGQVDIALVGKYIC